MTSRWVVHEIADDELMNSLIACLLAGLPNKWEQCKTSFQRYDLPKPSPLSPPPPLSAPTPRPSLLSAPAELCGKSFANPAEAVTV